MDFLIYSRGRPWRTADERFRSPTCRSRRALDALLADPSAGLGDVEIHDWRFGGRR